MLNLTEVELVLDPFMGSGTTCRVCDMLGRRELGISSSQLKRLVYIYRMMVKSNLFLTFMSKFQSLKS